MGKFYNIFNKRSDLIESTEEVHSIVSSHTDYPITSNGAGGHHTMINNHSASDLHDHLVSAGFSHNSSHTHGEDNYHKGNTKVRVAHGETHSTVQIH
jgi:hypothetical protein